MGNRGDSHSVLLSASESEQYVEYTWVFESQHGSLHSSRPYLGFGSFSMRPFFSWKYSVKKARACSYFLLNLGPLCFRAQGAMSPSAQAFLFRPVSLPSETE